MRAVMVISGRMPGLNDYVRAERANRYITWIEENRRRDMDNVAFAKKFILDGLVRAGVIRDDTPRYIAGLSDRFAYDKQNPRIEVEVRSA